MVTIILTHRVRDFAVWLAAFECGEAKRREFGGTVTGVYQSLQDPNMVTVTSEAESLEALQRFMADPEQQALMAEAGVEGAPTVLVLNKVAVAAHA